MGVYEVTEEEIANLAFDGPCAPAHPRFPITEGLSGASVASSTAENLAETPRPVQRPGRRRSPPAGAARSRDAHVPWSQEAR